MIFYRISVNNKYNKTSAGVRNRERAADRPRNLTMGQNPLEEFFWKFKSVRSRPPVRDASSRGFGRLWKTSLNQGPFRFEFTLGRHRGRHFYYRA